MNATEPVAPPVVLEKFTGINPAERQRIWEAAWEAAAEFAPPTPAQRDALRLIWCAPVPAQRKAPA